ncbi:MAG: hypothetical protein N3G20_00025, partial [Verrucomicrobiae bacterium]|nr:hypothetical protein [Verrucomicrobiae bacterium]
VLYSSALVSLGALEHAQKFFERYAPVVANSDNPDLGSIWVGYAELLIQMRKWDELQALAVQLRTLHPTRTILTGYSYFLDGRAALARGRADEAAANFSKCADEPFHVPAAAMHAARSLFLLGHGDLAKRIVEPLEAALANDVEYWQLLFDIEYARKEDETSLLRAAIKARELDPDRLMRQVNYAAALLINRQNPSEAINITLGFYQAYPQSLVAKINHSFALALNNRYTEAADILTKIAPSSLRETELTVYHYCWLEVHYGLRQLDLAAEDLKQINPKLLFPSQVKRVDQVRAEIESARATTFQRSN